jgi:hypothetical protein
MPVAHAFIAQLDRALAIAATRATLKHPEADAEPRSIEFLLDHPRTRDEAIVNAYGVSALVLTIPARAELVADPPRKFDVVTFFDGEQYVLDAVITRQANGIPVAFTAYVKGKGE